jgi:hypothetical protein
LKVDGEESGEKDGEDPENSTAHAPSLVIRCCTGQVTAEF